ncbi:helix-turn-helix domain-containing protein [Tissierella praeacuta]|uniref:helix-turn-helix domain-containing protein n=1 Tax=Tissierella praeacuta TaxID=43131 RepID=UPI003DA41B82
MIDIIKRIKELIEENKINQKELADRIGVSEVTISRYMTGERKPSLDAIILIANYFDVSLDYLVGISKIKKICVSDNCLEFNKNTLNSPSDKADIKKLGKIIQEKRIQMKLSLREAVDDIGISHNYLSIIEKGVDPRSEMPIKPTIETLQLLGEYFDIPITILLDLAGYDLSFMNTNKMASNLKLEYLQIAQELQDNEISKDDIRALIEVVKRNRQ